MTRNRDHFLRPGNCLFAVAVAVGLPQATYAAEEAEENPAADGTEIVVSGRRVSEASETIGVDRVRSEEHTSELQSLMRISYAVFCLKKKNNITDDEIS